MELLVLSAFFQCISSHRPTFAVVASIPTDATTILSFILLLFQFLVILGFASTDILSAWLPSYLLNVKGAEEARSRFELAGFWVRLVLSASVSPLHRHRRTADSSYVSYQLQGGIALGRIILTVPSNYLGERLASIGFLTLVMSFLTVLWQVGDLSADTATVVLTGICLGPGEL